MTTAELNQSTQISGFPFPLTKDDHAFFQRQIHDRVGIVLGWNKAPMMSRRLSQRLRVLGVADFSAYRRMLEDDPQSSEWQCVINAVTTNKTAFFRELHHFKLLENVLQRMVRQGSKRIRLWSAACSTGEEPFSMAMVAYHLLRGSGVDFKILATDIDDQILGQAQAAHYSIEARSALPKFAQALVRPVNGDSIVIAPEVRDLVTFKLHNLVSDNWPMNGPIDMIFCRNVLIYFDRTDQARIIKRMVGLLGDPGYLCLGHAEGLPSDLKSLSRAEVPNSYVVSVAQRVLEVS